MKQEAIILTTSAPDLCSVPRWQQYKATLDNLDYITFLRAARSNQLSVLLDVRTKDEYEAGSLEGAINVDYLSTTLADDLEALDPQLEYYVFCRTGRRSLRVCMLLKNIGVTVYNLHGGIMSK